jgi:hypothetical protein
MFKKGKTILDNWTNISLLLQEFRLETMARANQNADSASVASTEVSHQVWFRE